ncbi:MAG: glycosyltransferase family 39 protein, partial [Patescibacteria group bacterium]
FFSLYAFMKKSFDEKTAFISALLLATSPLAILFQSLALMDGMLFSCTIYIVYLLNEFRLREKKLILLTIGSILGSLLWIKTTALFIIIPTIIITVLLTAQKFGFIPRSLWRSRTKLISNTASIVLPVFFISLPLIFLPNFSKVLSEPGSFSFSLHELISFPITSWALNFVYAFYGYMIYFTPIVFLFGLIGAYTYRKEKSLAPLYFLGLMILFSIFLGKIFRIRYILFAVVGVIPFASLFLTRTHAVRLFNRLKYALCVGSSFSISFILIFNPHLFFSFFPENSILTREREYAYGWTSGDGVKNLIEFIEKTPRSMQRRIVLFTEDAPGNPSDFLLARYFIDQTMIISHLAISKDHLMEVSKNVKNAYVVTRNIRIDKTVEPYLSLVQSFPEYDSHEFLGLYKLQFP